MHAWEQTVSIIRGVGQQKAAQLAKLRLFTLGDLLHHYPRSYIDLSHPLTPGEACPGEVCAVRATVRRKHPETQVKGGLKLYKVETELEGEPLEITFFNTPYASQALKLDVTYLFYGRMEYGRGRGLAVSAPLVFPDKGGRPFSACYALTKGLSNRILSGLVEQALSILNASPAQAAPPEILPEKVRTAYGLIGYTEAVRAIHFPQNQEEMEAARRRLMFEELFTLSAGVALLRTRVRVRKAQPMENHSLQPFYELLPFTLTGAQKRAIKELTTDMMRDIPANRLVQGDVGSGKTMVAAAGAYFAFLSGAQSALMAPTELLARQHYEGLSALLGKLGMRVGLLTGSMTAAEKRAVREALAGGELDLCIGTHALITGNVEFPRLGLVITDEQHRFGVAQRTALGRKGLQAHTLVMSATPIPRTLALMIYGELDLSVIDELPPNRKPVTTYKISSGKRERAFGFIRDHLLRGLQAYIVCPLVEEGENTPAGLRSAVAYLEELREASFSGFSVGLLHGKLSPAEKEQVMGAFQRGEIQLLVATTVIEVGVDVPNAVIMMIENAERFGLSQLHQLRGRVGRGAEQSYCILLSDNRGSEALARLRLLCETNDGFRVAEFDLQARGPGNFLGNEQHGLPALRLADLTTDTRLVADAQTAAREVLESDPTLELPEHVPLRDAVERMLNAAGDRLN